MYHQSDNIIPIPGTQRPKYLEDNCAAIDIKLTREELAALGEIMPHGAAAGDRYPAQMMGTVNR